MEIFTKKKNLDFISTFKIFNKGFCFIYSQLKTKATAQHKKCLYNFVSLFLFFGQTVNRVD